MPKREPKQEPSPERGRPRHREGDRAISWTPESVLNTLPNPPIPPPSTPPPKNPIQFFHILSLLKTTPRAGWVQVGIHSGESIADHMYRMAVMAMIPPPSLSARLDMPRCVAMALVHDMAECLVGDFTPRDIAAGVVSRAEKGRREGLTMQFIQEGLLGGLSGQGRGLGMEMEEDNVGAGPGKALVSLFEEYEANQTLEARFLHDVDKLEMLLQVLEYERASGRRLDEFYHVVGEINLPEMREWAGVVVQEREGFIAGLEQQKKEKEGGKEEKRGSWVCRWWRRRKKGRI